MYKKILYSLGVIGIVSAFALSSTGAFFSDSETSTGNTFTAGAIDLKVDSQQHYAGLICSFVEGTTTPGYYWQAESQSTTRPELIGSPCSGTWTMKDLVPGIDKFFNFSDVKPGDMGENTISLHIDNNPAYACADLSNIQNNDNTHLTPETNAGDVTPGPVGQGELGAHLDFLVWNDNGAGVNAGNNIWDADEVGQNITGGAPSVNTTYTLADATGPAISPAGTSYLGIAWCAGTFTAGGPGVAPVCDGSTMGNESQTDSYSADIGIRVVQSRNNSEFRCTPPVVARPLVGAANYVAPDVACNVTADDDGVESAGHTVGLGAITSAIAQATTGQTICVAPGTYNEFIVNKSVTIMGQSDPEGGTPAVVVPSSTAVTDLALINSSDVTVTGLKFDGNGTVTAGQAAGVRVSPLAVSLSSVNVTYNVVTNISAATGFSAKGIQWFTDTDSGFSLSNSSFAHNTISNITSVNKGGYGIQTVGAMSNVSMNHNTISNTNGAWGAGVAVDTKNTTLTSVSGSSVTLNQIMTGVSNGISRFAVQVENSINATGLGVNQNNIETLAHGGGNVQLGTEGSLNAQSNWWGTAAPVLGTDVFNTGANTTDFTSPEASAFVLN